ncbi:preprotein translocase subunit YajC [bacterium]|nr:preprotein translocase subunit YajC [bacterium]MBU1652308.1 preprotein translocase subunit YajC [bacterium]
MFLAVIAQAGGAGAGGGIMGFLPFILILVIIYFLMLRPQMKRQKAHTTMLSALQKNDDIITSGGIHGRIIRLNERDNSLQIMISRGVVVTIERSAVTRKKQLTSKDGELPKEGSKPKDNLLLQDDKSKSRGEKNQKDEEKSFDKPKLESNGAMVMTGVDPNAEPRQPRGRRSPRRYSRSRPPRRDNQQKPADQNKSGSGQGGKQT